MKTWARGGDFNVLVCVYEPYTVSNSKFRAIIIAILLSNKSPGFHKDNIKRFPQKSTNLKNT